MKSSVSAPFGVAEVFRNGQSRQRDAKTRTWRLRHLPVNQRGLRLRRLAGLDDARFRHFQPQVVSFTSALANARKHGEAAVILGDVVDQLHDDDGLADAGAAEQSDLAALQERLNQIDDFHAGLEHLGARRLFVERWSQAMDRHSLRVFDRTQADRPVRR